MADVQELSEQETMTVSKMLEPGVVTPLGKKLIIEANLPKKQPQEADTLATITQRAEWNKEQSKLREGRGSGEKPEPSVYTVDVLQMSDVVEQASGKSDDEMLDVTFADGTVGKVEVGVIRQVYQRLYTSLSQEFQKTYITKTPEQIKALVDEDLAEMKERRAGVLPDRFREQKAAEEGTLESQPMQVMNNEFLKLAGLRRGLEKQKVNPAEYEEAVRKVRDELLPEWHQKGYLSDPEMVRQLKKAADEHGIILEVFAPPSETSST